MKAILHDKSVIRCLPSMIETYAYFVENICYTLKVKQGRLLSSLHYLDRYLNNIIMSSPEVLVHVGDSTVDQYASQILETWHEWKLGSAPTPCPNIGSCFTMCYLLDIVIFSGHPTFLSADCNLTTFLDIGRREEQEKLQQINLGLTLFSLLCYCFKKTQSHKGQQKQ